MEFADVARRLFSRFKWIWLALIVAAGIGAAIFAQNNGVTQYEARALVLARELEIRVDSFAETAEAVFEAGTVAVTTAERVGADAFAGDFVPESLAIDPVAGTAVAHVIGIHEDPATAVAYANTGATVFVEELNRIGPGLGQFEVNALATVAHANLPIGPIEGAVIGILTIAALIGGAVFLAATVLWVWIRPSAADSTTRQPEDVTAIFGIGQGYGRRLAQLGYPDVAALAGADPAELAQNLDLASEMVHDWVAQAQTRITNNSRA